ncbi:MAG: vWA domain-containing protein [Anaerolineales bacterium]|jgi:Flp pilus assembly protein TadG
MAKIVRNVKTKFSRMERGQVLVLVAAAAVGIIAIIGLSIDVGLMFIGNARLRRAVDSAALSAALQYRENASTTQANLLNILTNSANEFMVLNGFTNPVTHVYDCYNSPPDLTTTLCTTPNPRKLVEVTATVDIPLAFLTVIGINSVPVSATAISEAASVDVVLVIDRSESMTYGPDYLHPYAPGDPMSDPFYCNGIPGTGVDSGDIGSCQPFDQVINAAAAFTKILVPSYDLASVVTFDKEPTVVLPLLAGNDPSTVASTLRNLTVFQGVDAYQGASSNATDDYRCYDFSNDQCAGPGSDICTTTPILGSGSNYQGLIGRNQDSCPSVNPHFINPPDSSHYTTTNIGGGLELAGNQLASDKRQDVLWVVILLTDGVPNAGHNDDATIYFCPQDTWSLLPRCNHGDPNPADRLKAPVNGPFALEYDASDYAYDMADFVGLPYPKGQNALLYTIGLGPEVDNYAQPGYVDPNNTDLTDYPLSKNEGLGRIFLNYAAAAGRGSAFYAAQPSDLDKIFTLIGSNIATRISQ